jgi:hypothetical protein
VGVNVSNFGNVTACNASNFSLFSSVSLGKCQGGSFEYATAAAFQILIYSPCSSRPVPVTARSKALIALDSLKTGIVGSNPSRGMAVCPRCCGILCRWRPCDGPIPRPRCPT